ncbi:hypothetical protein HBI56_105110 [Parastagonospora nodorum]|uniref:C2H2-type domain-containing protein n=2 Tax=Phaeosphaeria nodorum (strain SN15 / ATCC MYA-4574 / FGSC 10173) TaxID=321614 RepID=A0A7U2I5S7_PHANO|nr:hypothetical protein SNOG_11454 [Parastagonospora nodorum SN15]KAH3911354.1 hypothetical protein HBH56_133800 [Parastagonospora nodorum]EAT81162.1 hypothetical protein SNOG_11454 [Parastagonospora nodorum SN15]KAH3926959.1 hypothetical protein HBH54_159490 [Parastagonospora nodorum]KAH3949410.1 hypothetical protein HBH53_088870 [Parastagonospora nodorum]KAH3974754.1 hypothetical protein HBH52_132870 [Parastagonospora nodorum]
MAQRNDGSLADWEDGSFSVEPTPYSTHMSDRGGIPLVAQRRFEGASANSLHPIADQISVYANNDINVRPGTFRNRLSGQQAASFRNDGSYRRSEHSDPANTACPPPEHINSTQSDLQSISSWIIDDNESSADPGIYNNPSTVFDSLPRQYHNSSDYSASPFLFQIATEPALDVFSEPAQTEALPAVGWDLRAIRPPDFHDPAYDLTIRDHSSDKSCKKFRPSPSISDYSTTISLVEQLRPCTVSSEVIGSDRSRSEQTSIKPYGDHTVCEICGAKFTGRYARGNCSRHVRLLHSEKPAQLGSDLVCRVCHKRFKRQDARRKHEWRKHEIGETKPIPRRQLASAGKLSHAEKHETGSDHGTATCTTALPEESGVELPYSVPPKTHRAYDHFANARMKLDDHAYNLYCHVVLLQYQRIVEAFQFEHSELHAAFVQQLHVLKTELLSEPYGQSDFNQPANPCPTDAQHPDHEHDGGVSDRQNKGKSPISRRTSKASSRSHPYSHRPSKKTADPLLDALEQFDVPEYQELDCPIHKWHLMYGQTSPCNGCGKPYMNGVRQHLLPTYSHQHRAQLPFIQRCDNCKDDFVDAHIWAQGGHWVRRQQGAGTCRARSQPQGSSLIIWARLFLKIYPEETQVTSPYRNDQRLLPANLVALLRNDIGLPQVMSRVNPPTSPNPSLTLQHPEGQHDQGTETQNLQQRFEQMEAELAQNATVDTLVSRASEVLAQFLAQEFTETNHERVDIDAIKIYYINRLDQLRQNAWAQLTQAHQPHPEFDMEQALLAPTGLIQAEVPAFGGAADFLNLPYQTEQTLGTSHIPHAEMGTQSSSQDYHTGDVSFGITTSSRTSHDLGLPSNDQSQQLDAQFCCLADLTDYSHTSHNHRQYLSPHDVYLLDQPGSSRLPQRLAANSLMSEVDSMMTTPLDADDPFYYASMDPEYDMTFSDVG